MKIYLKINRVETWDDIKDIALSAHIFPPKCINDEYFEEMELVGCITRMAHDIYLVNEHCISGWLDVKKCFTERSGAEDYARSEMKAGRIKRILSQSGLVPYFRVDGRSVRNRVKSTRIFNLKEYWSAKDKLAEVPVTPIPMTVALDLV